MQSLCPQYDTGLLRKPVTKINKTVPIQKACVWNVDTGAAFKGPLTIMDVDTKEFWQSEPLNELYFNEKGRN